MLGDELINQLAEEAERGYDLSRLRPRRNKLNPTIGRIVIYRSRTGSYDCPAMVAATKATLHMPNVEAGWIPDILSETHVHLVVFSAGKPGKRADATDFLVESPHGRSENMNGTYQEWDIPFDPNAGPGTWRWPTIHESI